MSGVKKGSIVTCTITKVVDNGLEVEVGDGVPGFIRKAELSRDRSEQRPDRFAAGEKIDAKVTQLDRGGRRLTLSVKAREIDEEKQAMAEYGSSDSGASLGDILGAALQEKREANADAEPAEDKAPAKKKAKKEEAAEEAAEEAPAEEAAAEEAPAEEAAAEEAPAEEAPAEEAPAEEAAADEAEAEDKKDA